MKAPAVTEGTRNATTSAIDPLLFSVGLKQRGLEIREQEGDGNCLFRAVSLQVYGDASMHGQIRKQCMDFMVRTRGEKGISGWSFQSFFSCFSARNLLLGTLSLSSPLLIPLIDIPILVFLGTYHIGTRYGTFFSIRHGRKICHVCPT